MRPGHCATCQSKLEPRFVIFINQTPNVPTFYTVPCAFGMGGTPSAADTQTMTPFLKAFRDFEAAYNFIAETRGRAETTEIEVVSGDLPPRLFLVVMRHADEDHVIDCRAPEVLNMRVIAVRPQLACAA